MPSPPAFSICQCCFPLWGVTRRFKKLLSGPPGQAKTHEDHAQVKDWMRLTGRAKASTNTKQRPDNCTAYDIISKKSWPCAEIRSEHKLEFIYLNLANETCIAYSETLNFVPRCPRVSWTQISKILRRNIEGTAADKIRSESSNASRIVEKIKKTHTHQYVHIRR